jgi:hypothetical protein
MESLHHQTKHRESFGLEVVAMPTRKFVPRRRGAPLESEDSLLLVLRRNDMWQNIPGCRSRRPQRNVPAWLTQANS